MKVEELFGRCAELARMEPSADGNRLMHETLVLCCGEALRHEATGFGNLFSQVDFLAKRRGMTTADRMGVQLMRRHSNHADVLTGDEWRQDVRMLVLFVSAVFQVSVPSELVALIPRQTVAPSDVAAVNTRYLRCIVSRWDEKTIAAETTDGQHLTVDYSAHAYLQKMLREGMQLNLLDNHVEPPGTVTPGMVVVEPDYLVDISAIARCFQDNYGHHPLLYTAERLKPRGNSQAMLLGNFAGAALDDIIHHPDYRLNDTLNDFFRRQALQFTTCSDFNASNFLEAARQQSANIQEAVSVLFEGGYDRRRALLEPSFVCERLGLQGRVDLMTSDLRLLIEQKSGKNYNLERDTPTAGTGLQKEEHYVQLLLYYGVLRYNFGRTDSQCDIRLLYSRYPARRGLLYVNFYRELFREAIKLRNQVVATDMLIAREGAGRILPLLRPDVVYAAARRDGFFHRYMEPPLADLQSSLSRLEPLERAYLERMLTFVYREQLLQKVGRQEGQGGSTADLWNMPLAEKLETGNIITSETGVGASNFRRGDMVYLYNYSGDEPDARKAILYKGTIADISADSVSVQLNEQQHSDPMQQGRWAIEHAGSDQNTTSAIKSLFQFVNAGSAKRQLLLGQREPRRDATLRLSRSYHPHYDDVLLRARQSLDYFLLVGPPGTGKTSMALRFLVSEGLQSPSLLLMAYTNRAVDEICAMLDDAGHNYLRIGSETACDPRFRGRLLESMLGRRPKLDTIRQFIEQVPIVVGTTSMLQARPFIFQLKHFTLCIVDEASQILEPGLVGLLSGDSIDRFILVGDHKQLPAVVQQNERESAVSDPRLTAIGLTDCRQSLFERLLRWEQHCGRSQFVGILRKQGRMHPDIAAFPNEMFYHEEHLEPVPLEHQRDTSLHYDLPSLDSLDDLLKQERVAFFDTGACKPHEPGEWHKSSDKVNPAEARLVADLLRRIYRFYGQRFDPQKTVGVIVPYRNQIAMIRHEIERLGLPPVVADISIDTVERYQGSQRDVIVYSFTVSRPYQIDFLTSNCFVENGRVIDRKLNVALTRARKQLLMTGNKEILRQNSIFMHLIARYEKNFY